MERASEAGHYYDIHGKPVYEVPLVRPAKDGRTMTKTTLRHARELELVPSVTTVLKVIPNPGLERWKAQTARLAGYTTPRLPHETDEEWDARAREAEGSIAAAAAQLGTDVHALIECWYAEQVPPLVSEQAQRIAEAAIFALDPLVTVFESEIPFARLGYGGKVDAIGTILDRAVGGACGSVGRKCIIDWKTTKTDPAKAVWGWPSWRYQLAAYRRGLDAPDLACCNVVISTTEPGRVEVVWHDEDALRKGLDIFDHAFRLWRSLNDYNPPGVVA